MITAFGADAPVFQTAQMNFDLLIEIVFIVQDLTFSHHLKARRVQQTFSRSIRLSPLTR
jgi:hypothetical protein